MHRPLKGEPGSLVVGFPRTPCCFTCSLKNKKEESVAEGSNGQPGASTETEVRPLLPVACFPVASGAVTTAPSARSQPGPRSPDARPFGEALTETYQFLHFHQLHVLLVQLLVLDLQHGLQALQLLLQVHDLRVFLGETQQVIKCNPTLQILN